MISTLFLSQSDVTPKPVVIGFATFPRLAPLAAESSDWFIAEFGCLWLGSYIWFRDKHSNILWKGELTKKKRGPMTCMHSSISYPSLSISITLTWLNVFLLRTPQVETLLQYFPVFDKLKKEFFIGEMIWNFADFMTQQGKFTSLIADGILHRKQSYDYRTWPLSASRRWEKLGARLGLEFRIELEFGSVGFMGGKHLR